MKIHVAVGRLDRLHSAHNSQTLALWRMGSAANFFWEKKRKKGEKTPLKAAHANEELARWRDLGREEGASE